MLSYLAALAVGSALTFGGQGAVRALRRQGGAPVEYATVPALQLLQDNVRVNAMKQEDRLLDRILQEVAHEAKEREALAASVHNLMTVFEERGGPIGRSEVSSALDYLHQHHQAQTAALADSLAAVVQRVNRPAPPVVPAIPEGLFPEGTPLVPLRRQVPAPVALPVQDGAVQIPVDPSTLLAGLQAAMAGMR